VKFLGVYLIIIGDGHYANAKRLKLWCGFGQLHELSFAKPSPHHGAVKLNQIAIFAIHQDAGLNIVGLDIIGLEKVVLIDQ